MFTVSAGELSSGGRGDYAVGRGGWSGTAVARRGVATNPLRAVGAIRLSKVLQMSLIHNERTKLTTTYFNGLAIAVFAVGAFAPAVAGISQAPGAINWATAAVVVICLLASGALHLAARRLLKGLL